MPKIVDGLRWYQGKRLVSNVRGSDYAHAGEEDAIIKCLSRFPKNTDRVILDVGCGQGGTAHFIQTQGWGKTVGFDIEQDSIDYARRHYPNIEFYALDVAIAGKNLSGRSFDIICLFNSFYAFPDQISALKSLRLLATQNTYLIIFEYTDITTDGNNPFIRRDDPIKSFLPIRFDAISSMLARANWSCIEVVTLENEFRTWYEQLVDKIVNEKTRIVSEFGEEGYLKALNRYTGIYHAIRDRILGGCIIYAVPTRINEPE